MKLTLNRRTVAVLKLLAFAGGAGAAWYFSRSVAQVPPPARLPRRRVVEVPHSEGGVRG